MVVLSVDGSIKLTLTGYKILRKSYKVTKLQSLIEKISFSIENQKIASVTVTNFVTGFVTYRKSMLDYISYTLGYKVTFIYKTYIRYNQHK